MSLPLCRSLIVSCALTAGLSAQVPVDVTSIGPATPGATSTPIDKRAYGVLPNYRTANDSDPFTPLTTKRKFYIASKDSFDVPVYFTGAVFAGIAQLNNSHPGFGQGMEGFAKRYGTSTVDQVIGNFMTEGLMPALFREDPRYFRKGSSYGSVKKRMLYAASRVLIAKTDKGNWNVNYSEIVGNSIGAGIANLYYPDERKFSDNAQRMYTQVGTDAVSQILKEFWPDIKSRYFSHRRKQGAVAQTRSEAQSSPLTAESRR
jgi:hypothetical protein